MPNNEEQDYRVRDKVRVRIGEHKGQRGIVRASSKDMLDVILDSGITTQVNHDNVTNLSLAARKAWRTMRSQHNS